MAPTVTLGDKLWKISCCKKNWGHYAFVIPTLYPKCLLLFNRPTAAAGAATTTTTSKLVTLCFCLTSSRFFMIPMVSIKTSVNCWSIVIFQGRCSSQMPEAWALKHCLRGFTPIIHVIRNALIISYQRHRGSSARRLEDAADSECQWPSADQRLLYRDDRSVQEPADFHSTNWNSACLRTNKHASTTQRMLKVSSFWETSTLKLYGCIPKIPPDFSYLDLGRFDPKKTRVNCSERSVQILWHTGDNTTVAKYSKTKVY